MKLKHLLLVLLLTLSACATPNIAKDFALERAGGTGVVTGSITYDGGHGAYRLHVENKVTGQAYLIEHGSSQSLNLSYAFKGEPANPALGKKGSPFAVELPAGTYVIRSWQISQGMANVSSTAPTGIEFEIRPREAIYVGGFHFHETSRFGRAVTGASVSLSDESKRDEAAVRAQFPALAAVPLTQTLSAGARLENIGGASAGNITIPVFVPVGR